MKEAKLFPPIRNFLEIFMHERPDIFCAREYEKCTALARDLYNDDRVCKMMCQLGTAKEISAGIIWLFSYINLLDRKPDQLSFENIAEYFQVSKETIEEIAYTLQCQGGIEFWDDRYVV